MNEIDAKLLYAISALFGCCGLFIVLVCAIQRKLFLEVWRVYAIGFVIVASILVPIYIGNTVVLVAMLVLGYCCTYEMSQTITKKNSVLRNEIILSIVCIAMAYLQNYPAMIAAFILFIVYAFMRFLWSSSPEESIHRLLIACYPGLFFCHFAFIACSANGFRYMVFLYAITEINDATAYLFGKFFGKHKLWPEVSPNKTYEGSIAGICFAVITGFSLKFAIPELSSWKFAGVVIAVAILGPVGDLVASKIKRIAGVKDFSNIVPTQGGVLDVLDSLIFSAPVFYYLLI